MLKVFSMTLFGGKCMSAIIRVGIADSHDIVRAALKEFLRTIPDFQCVGEAGTPEGTLLLCKRTVVDVLLLDFGFEPGFIRLIQKMHQWCEQMKILILTANMEVETVKKAFDAGARGYLFKTNDAETIEQAIRAVYQGQRVIDSSVE
jgi:two-component system, NarL family, invasion response regulator UvrY